jgi:hypothetical protein
MRLFRFWASRTVGVPTRNRGVPCQPRLVSGLASRRKRDGQKRKVTHRSPSAPCQQQEERGSRRRHEPAGRSLERRRRRRRSCFCRQPSFVSSSVQDAAPDRTCQRILSLSGDGASELTSRQTGCSGCNRDGTYPQDSRFAKHRAVKDGAVQCAVDEAATYIIED